MISNLGLPPLDEFKREGHWKLLTIREFGGDTMIIVTLNPIADKEKDKEVKEKLCEKYV